MHHSRAPSRLTTQRLRTARFPEQHINVFAAGNLRVRRDEMVAPLALAHDHARLIKSLSEISRVPQRRIEEGVAEIGPFTLSWHPNDEWLESAAVITKVSSLASGRTKTPE